MTIFHAAQVTQNVGTTLSEGCSLVSLNNTLSQRGSNVINVVGHQKYQKVVKIRFVDVVLKRCQNVIFIT